MADAILAARPCRKCNTIFSGRQCPACQKVYAAEWYAANRERQKAAMAANYAANKEERRAKSLEYRAKTKEKKAAAAARYRAANKEKIAAALAAYRAENAEELKAKKAAAYAKIPAADSRLKARSYYLNNKERLNALSAEWREQNPHKSRALQHNYRARKRGAGSASVDIVERLMGLQRGKCACCRVDLSKTVYHVDHIEPLSKGGRHEDTNLQLLCRHCNQTKHAKLPHEFMQEHGFLL